MGENLLLAHDGSQIPRAIAGVERAHLRPGLAKLRRVGRNGEVAQNREHMPSADGVAVHHSDDGLGHDADEPLQIEHIQARDVVLAHVPPVAALLLVAAGAERLVLVAAAVVHTGQQNDTYGRIVARLGESVVHLRHRQRGERVAPLGPIDGDLRHPIAQLIANLAVLLIALPIVVAQASLLQLASIADRHVVSTGIIP